MCHVEISITPFQLVYIMFDTETNGFQRIFSQGKEYVELKVKYARLTVAEKLSVMLSSALIILILVLAFSIAMFFISAALVSVMSESVGSAWSCAIMGGAYLIVVVLFIAFRKPLVVNPVTRFVTRHML